MIAGTLLVKYGESPETRFFEETELSLSEIHDAARTATFNMAADVLSFLVRNLSVQQTVPFLKDE